jgi:hypothetical protein
VYWPLFTALLGFALGGSVVWSLQAPQATIEKHNPAPEQDSTDTHAKEKADEALARYTFWLTVFTGILALATVGLGAATIGLYTAGEKQIAVTAKAADAAQKSAEIAESALLNVEVAYPYAVIRDHGIQVEHGRIRSVTIGTVVNFYFTNHGRTPADITEVYCQMYVDKGIPDAIIPPVHPYNWLDGDVVPAGRDSKDFSFNMNDVMFETFYSGRVKDANNIIWFMGYARYNDVFGNEYILGFCFAFGTARATFYPVGRDGYNYRKKIKSTTDDPTREPAA